jgi:hypothetical protein
MSAMTPEQEKHLVAVISATFGARNFDASSIIGEAGYNTTLAAAIDAAVPHSRYRSGGRRGRYRYAAVRRVLQPLSRHFDSDDHGWWLVPKR